MENYSLDILPWLVPFPQIENIETRKIVLGLLQESDSMPASNDEVWLEFGIEVQMR